MNDELSPRERALLRLRKEWKSIQDAMGAAIDAVNRTFVPDYSTPEASKKTSEALLELIEPMAAASEPFLKQMEEWKKNLSAEDREFLIMTKEELEELEKCSNDIDDSC